MLDKRNEDTSLQFKLLNYSFIVQKITGLYPFQKKSYMLFGLLIVFTHLLSFGLTMYMLYSELNNIESLMLGFDGIITHIQATLKCLPLILHRNEMRMLIEGLPNFWRTKNEDGYIIWIKLSKVYCLLMVLGVIVFVAYPGIFFKPYIPNFQYAYAIILITQKVQFSFCGFILMGTDLFYLALFAIIKIQYQTLEADLKLLHTSENKSESLKLWIKQHIFLTKYTKCFVRTFSEAWLLQYAVATINLCTEAYFFSERLNDGLYVTITYMLEIFVQISLICLPAHEITNRAMHLSDALYSMEWFNFPLKEMKILPLLIQQAQTPVRFVAGGFVTLDKQAMTAILQNAYTFYTLARQMKHN